LLARRKAAASSDCDLIFHRMDCMPLDKDTVSDQFKRLVKRIEAPHLSLRSLRHTHATWLMEQGTPLRVIMKRMGHGSITTTANVYVHATEQVGAEAAEKLGERSGKLRHESGTNGQGNTPDE